MRSSVVLVSLSLLAAAPVAASPLGAPDPWTPYSVSQFDGPSRGDVPQVTGLYQTRTSMERLRQVCSSTAKRDRQTCDRAWREINAAYAQIKAEKAAAR